MLPNKKRDKNTNIYIPSHLIGLELDGIVQGNEIVRKKHVDIHTFDVVKIVWKSENEITKRTFYHALGYLNAVKYFLILKVK